LGPKTPARGGNCASTEGVSEAGNHRSQRVVLCLRPLAGNDIHAEDFILCEGAHGVGLCSCGSCSLGRQRAFPSKRNATLFASPSVNDDKLDTSRPSELRLIVRLRRT
jgi:hypothetical protein